MLFLTGILLLVNLVLFLLYDAKFLLVVNSISETPSQSSQGTNVKFNSAIRDIIFSGNLLKLLGTVIYIILYIIIYALHNYKAYLNTLGIIKNWFL